MYVKNYIPPTREQIALKTKRRAKELANSRGVRLWTLEEDNLLERYSYQGLADKKIAELLNRSVYSVGSRRSNKGLTKKKTFISFEQIIFIKSNYGRYPAKEIAAHLSLTVQQVYWFARSLSLTGRYIGENHSCNVIPDDEIDLIRELHDEGMSAYLIAQKMERNYRYVKTIVRYDCRLDLTPHFDNWRSPNARNHLRSHEKKDQ